MRDPEPYQRTENDNQCQVATDKELHKLKLCLFKEQCSVERAAKNHNSNAFDETYLLYIKKDHIGSNTITTSDIFKHLHKRCGKITDNDLLVNKFNMTAEWDP